MWCLAKGISSATFRSAPRRYRQDAGDLRFQRPVLGAINHGYTYGAHPVAAAAALATLEILNARTFPHVRHAKAIFLTRLHAMQKRFA